MVENARLLFWSEKNSPKHGSIFGHFFKKHTRETRERKENESIQQLFLEKEALKSLERGGSKKKEAKRENVLFCRFRSPLICGCTSVSFKNTTLNYYLFSWL